MCIRDSIDPEELGEEDDDVRDGVCVPAAHVEDLARHVGSLGGEEIGLYHVGDEGEIARLQPVAMDLDGLAPQSPEDETRDDLRVVGLGVLARTKDVEICLLYTSPSP